MLSTMGFVRKLGVGVVSFVLLASCVGALGDDETSNESTNPSTEPSSNSSTTGDGADDGADEPEELSQRDQWTVNYEDHEGDIRKALSRKLPAYRFPQDSGTQAVATCKQLAKESPLKKRLSSAGARWSGDANQSGVIITVVANSVCPEVAKVHTEQVVAKKKADARVAAKKAAAAERARVVAAKKAERERQAAALAAQQKAAQDQTSSVYYENCTAVEAAGAAPIYSGDPGYSTDLDRDGDGVACET